MVLIHVSMRFVCAGDTFPNVEWNVGLRTIGVSGGAYPR